MMTGSTFRAGVASIAAMPAALNAAVAGRTPLMLDMKRMAIHDGPGVRITFFVKGCPLRCVWCHNPEAIGTEKQMARFHLLCRRCAKCTQDELTCPTRALKVYGKSVTVEALVEKALEDKALYNRTGGGITVSGGEPLFSWDVPYRPGTLEIRAKMSDGRIATARRVTAGSVMEYRVTRDFAADGLVFFRIDAVDANGTRVVDCEDALDVSVQNGELLALDNGSPTDHVPFSRACRHLCRGSLVAIVKGARNVLPEVCVRRINIGSDK